ACSLRPSIRPDNVKTIIGNGKIFADTIQNFSANPYRCVELMAQLVHGCGPANGDCAAETSTGTSAERAGRAGTRCRDPDIQPFGRGAYSSPVLQKTNTTGKCISTRTG